MSIKRIAVSTVLVLGLLLSHTGTMAQTRTVTVGVFPWEPYVSQWQDGYGMLTELLVAALKTQGYDVAITKDSFAQVLSSLRSGKVDLAPAVSYSDERSRTIDFTSAFYFVDMTIIFRKGSLVYASMQDLKHSHGGVMAGTFWEKILKKEGAPYETAPTQEQNIRKLIAGVVDFVCMPRDVAMTIMRQFDEDPNSFEFVLFKRDGQPVGVSKKTRFTTLRDDVEKGLAAIKANGQYGAIVAKYQ